MLVLSQLRCPYIVPVLAACLDPDHLLLAMEYYPQGSLAHVLHTPERARRLNWHDRVRISMEIAKAMAFLYAHKPPIEHRDLKPLNVLVCALINCLKTSVCFAVLFHRWRCEKLVPLFLQLHLWLHASV
jgi:serine/threonine protein kinase